MIATTAKIFAQILLGAAAIGAAVAFIISLVEDPTSFPETQILLYGAIRFVGLAVFVLVVLWGFDKYKSLSKK